MPNPTAAAIPIGVVEVIISNPNNKAAPPAPNPPVKIPPPKELRILELPYFASCL